MNFQAFIATTCSVGIDNRSGADSWAVQVLRIAFETLEKREKWETESYIMGAAQWIRMLPLKSFFFFFFFFFSERVSTNYSELQSFMAKVCFSTSCIQLPKAKNKRRATTLGALETISPSPRPWNHDLSRDGDSGKIASTTERRILTRARSVPTLRKRL